MKKIHMIWIAVLLLGCEKFAEFPNYSPEQVAKLSASLPYMQVEYNDTDFSFYIIQTIVQANDTDFSKHTITIYGLAQFYSIQITMPGDTLPTGYFSLDARTSTVSLMQYGQVEIGKLCSFCSFDVCLDKTGTGAEGSFSGALRNPNTGTSGAIRGSFINVTSY